MIVAKQIHHNDVILISVEIFEMQAIMSSSLFCVFFGKEIILKVSKFRDM